MAQRYSLGVALLLTVWSAVACDLIPDGVLHMECHDRYFMIAVALSFTGEKPHFDAIDKMGVYTITKQNEAKCGYCVTILPLLGYVELRASYYSCHTEKVDKDFKFSFNLITTQDDIEIAYPLNMTCSPSRSLSPREVTCAVNYMEVLLEGVSSCSLNKDDSALAPTHGSAASDWQVSFQGGQESVLPMNLSEAQGQGYMFDVSDGLVVFRTPYGQPDSFHTEVHGISVEVVHATLFSKQGWVVLMVDLVAACSLDEGSYDIGHVIWKTPEVFYPGLHSTQLGVGLNGALMAPPVAEKQGYLVETEDDMVKIGIPFDAAGGYRKSLVSGDLYEFYLFHFFLEQVLLDDAHVETVIRFHRVLFSPLLHRPVFVQNQTDLEERMFTVYIGEIPEDVALTAIQLNGHKCDVKCSNATTYNVTEVIHANHTHGYTLKVPFDHPFVDKEFFADDLVLHYKLNIKYTLSVEGQTEVYVHLASVVAVFTGISPPAFDAVCLDSGMRFELEHQPFDYLWDISIGPELLTLELAAERGYIMTTDSQSLVLEVPLFTPGYKYKEISLGGFIGTFEILVRDRRTWVVQTSNVKTCLFTSSELIVCSTDGMMTVVADVSMAIPSEGLPESTTLIDKYCGPQDTDDSRALFTIPLNTCGTMVKIGKKNVTYQNEIFYDGLSANDTERVIVQCTYPLASLHRLFSLHIFESDAIGLGRIIHTNQTTAGLAFTPVVALQTTTKRPPVKPVAFLPPRRYFSKYYNHANTIRKASNPSLMRRNEVHV